MKAYQHIFTLAATGLVLLFLANCASASDESAKSIGWFRRTFLSLSWAEVAQVVESPKDISRRVRTQVTYVKDAEDVLSKPEETWKKQIGDCEDMAACVVELCHKNGFDARIHVFYKTGTSEGHAIATGEDNGKLWISSNGWHMKVKSLADAQREVARDMGWENDLVGSVAWKDLKEQDLGESISVAGASEQTPMSGALSTSAQTQLSSPARLW
jgi:hypothetical protein